MRTLRPNGDNEAERKIIMIAASIEKAARCRRDRSGRAASAGLRHARAWQGNVAAS
jgi:hypothetical protein